MNHLPSLSTSYMVIDQRPSATIPAMNHDKLVSLEHLLQNAIGEKTGKECNRMSSYKGVKTDADWLSRSDANVAKAEALLEEIGGKWNDMWLERKAK